MLREDPMVGLREVPWASFPSPAPPAPRPFFLPLPFSGDIVQSGRVLPRAQDQG